MNRALGLQDLERLGPELQPQDVAFPGQQVVVHVHPRHRLQVAADDAVGDEGGDLGVLVAAMLDVVERVGPRFQPFLVGVVPLGHAGVQIPAVEVEPRGVGDRANLGERLAGQVPEADDDVGDLHAGVVDVVLYFDRDTAEAEHTHEGVTERGVPKVADVGRLVGVDGRVLDDRFACRRV